MLFEQQKSEEVLAIKWDGDSLVDFCGYLMAPVACDGMLISNADITPFQPTSVSVPRLSAIYAL
jgi:putative DNA primase/helicase